jgi:N-acetylmuramoyl-L-alanine amidase
MEQATPVSYRAPPSLGAGGLFIMFTRPNIAGFLQGLFVLPLCALFGGLVALLFRWHGVAAFATAAICALFPLAGALKTRQWALLSGLCAGIIAAVSLFAVLAPARAQISPASLSNQALRGFVVCVDPGHASETSRGTESRDGKLSELHVNWVVAQRLIVLLKADGATVVTTKQRESQIVTNRRRAEIANAAHAKLFLRLHCDAGEQSGLATYYPDRQGTRFGVTGPSRAVMAASHHAAQIFQPAVIAALHGSLRDAGIKGDSKTGVGGRQGALTGSIFSHVPALTVEMCVLTNAHDYHFIRTLGGQEEMARALLAGIEAYAKAAGV